MTAWQYAEASVIASLDRTTYRYIYTFIWVSPDGSNQVELTDPVEGLALLNDYGAQGWEMVNMARVDTWETDESGRPSLPGPASWVYAMKRAADAR